MLGSQEWAVFRKYLADKASREQADAFSRSPLTPEGQQSILVSQGRASGFLELAGNQMTTKDSELLKFVQRETNDRPSDRRV